MHKVLVTGGRGQLGREIRRLVPEKLDRFCFTDRDSLDVTDPEALQRFVCQHDVSVIVNCAAYTAVDRAEEEKSAADAINHQAVKYMAHIAREKDIRLIHISTDYVFDGKGCKPYTEEDDVCPLNVYGRTKAEGERAIQEICPPGAVIIRTSWVYSSYGNNFVTTMLRLGKEREYLGVVCDQIGGPTYAMDLAKVILAITEGPMETEGVALYHYSNEGVASWYDFAKAIFEIAGIDCFVEPIMTESYPLPAKRPFYSVLNKSKIKKRFDLEIPHWREGLEMCIERIGKAP